MVSPNLSPTEVTLIRLLQKNARQTNKELARAAGIAESTCLERIRSLQQRGVIVGYHAEIDLRSLGRGIRALISVRLQPKTSRSVRAFVDEVMAARETLSIDSVTGADDFLVEVAVHDVESLGAFVLEHVTSRPDVADTRTALVYEHHRNTIVEPLGPAP